MVTKDDYKLMLDRAVQELTDAVNRQAELDAEREQLDERIAELKQGILGLAPLCGVSAQMKYAELLPEYNLLPVGLKEGVLVVLGTVKNDRYITAVTIRDNLEATGYEIKSKNILPSIHNVLKRMDGKEIESTDLNGKTGYRLRKREHLGTGTSTSALLGALGSAVPTREEVTRNKAFLTAFMGLADSTERQKKS